MERAEKRGIRIDYIQPGKLQQNGYTERCGRNNWIRIYLKPLRRLNTK